MHVPSSALSSQAYLYHPCHAMPHPGLRVCQAGSRLHTGSGAVSTCSQRRGRMGELPANPTLASVQLMRRGRRACGLQPAQRIKQSESEPCGCRTELACTACACCAGTARACPPWRCATSTCAARTSPRGCWCRSAPRASRCGTKEVKQTERPVVSVFRHPGQGQQAHGERTACAPPRASAVGGMGGWGPAAGPGQRGPGAPCVPRHGQQP